MKKSTILMLLIIYVVAFFVVGLLGVSVSAHYHVNYVTEIIVEPLKETHVIEYTQAGGHSREEIVSDHDKSHARYNRKYNYCTTFEPGLILGFRVQVKPDNSTYDKYETIYTEKPNTFTLEQSGDSTIYIHMLKKGTFTLRFQSTDGNRTETELKVTVFKEGTVLE